MSNQISRWRKKLYYTGVLLAALLTLPACNVNQMVNDLLPLAGQSTQESLADRIPLDETAEPTPNPTQSPTDFDVIKIWVEPQFDPNGEEQNALMLKQYIDSYSEVNPGIKISVRIKESEGDHSLLNALSITSQAAPDALPTLVLLSRHDIEIAARDGLIRPIDFFADVYDNNDWYPFAKELGIVNNELVGIPFAADVLVLASNAESLTQDYVSLQDARREFGQIGIFLSENKSLVPYLWYQSTGGKIINDTNHPIIEEASLLQMFDILAENQRAGPLPQFNTQFTSSDDLETAIADGEIDSVIVWTGDVSEDFGFTYIPALGDSPYTYADGWVWCLVQKPTTDLDLNIDFMQYLTTPEFLAAWTAESRYLPVRPSSINSLKSERAFLDNLLLSTDIVPPRVVLDDSQEILTRELFSLLAGDTTPEIAVKNVLDSLDEVQQSE